MTSIIRSLDRRSGITYVYESESYWDRDKKAPRSRRRLIGKVDPETGEVVPTSGTRRRAMERRAAEEAGARASAGAGAADAAAASAGAGVAVADAAADVGPCADALGSALARLESVEAELGSIRADVEAAIAALGR